jgi:peptidoglycan/LPS O-acetylase OafA/YrhL
VSFAFYLIHTAKFLMPVYRRIGWLELPSLVEAILCYGFATLVSIGLFELVERPCQRRILAWGGALGGRREQGSGLPVNLRDGAGRLG